jgi:uncharacterized lipoprotein YehR (DUF1307 family)
MKRNIKAISIVFMLVFCMALVACDKTFTTNAYKTLSASATIYEQGYPAFLEAHEKGLVTDAQKAQGKELATKYWGAYHMAVEALIVYNEVSTAENKDKVSVALIQMSKSIADFSTYITPFIGGN